MITDGAGCPAGYYLKLDTQVCTLLSSWSDAAAVTAKTKRVADSLGLGGELEVCKGGFYAAWGGSSYACADRTATGTVVTNYGLIINKMLVLAEGTNHAPLPFAAGDFSKDIVCIDNKTALDSQDGTAVKGVPNCVDVTTAPTSP